MAWLGLAWLVFGRVCRAWKFASIRYGFDAIALQMEDADRRDRLQRESGTAGGETHAIRRFQLCLAMHGISSLAFVIIVIVPISIHRDGSMNRWIVGWFFGGNAPFPNPSSIQSIPSIFPFNAAILLFNSITVAILPFIANPISFPHYVVFGKLEETDAQSLCSCNRNQADDDLSRWRRHLDII